jgi:hypothetical protein
VPAARRGIGICSGDSYRSGETTGLNCGVARRKHSQSYVVSILLQSGAISLPAMSHFVSSTMPNRPFSAAPFASALFKSRIASSTVSNLFSSAALSASALE